MISGKLCRIDAAHLLLEGREAASSAETIWMERHLSSGWISSNAPLLVVLAGTICLVNSTLIPVASSTCTPLSTGNDGAIAVSRVLRYASSGASLSDSV